MSACDDWPTWKSCGDRRENDKNEAVQEFFRQLVQMKENAEKFDPEQGDEILAVGKGTKYLQFP